MRCLGSVFLTFSVGLIFPLSPNMSHLSQAANILGVFPYRHLSAFQVLRPLVGALVAKGHNVTMISPLSIPLDIEGVRHVRVPMLNNHIQDMLSHFQDFHSSKWNEAILAAAMLSNISQAILSDNGVQQIMRNKDEHFDMIILEAIHLDALYGLAEYYNASLMGVSCMRFNWKIDYLAGNSAPSIYEPISPLGYSTDGSILGRLHNFIYITEEQLLDRLIMIPSQLRIFKKHFGYSAEKMKELRARFSIILVNNHFSMGRVRANVPNIIEIGGIHLSEPPEPCDAQLQQFLDEAQHGVIYFSLGLDVFVKFLPDNLQQIFVQTFAKLEQRVVWKSEVTTMPNKTDNVYLILRSPQRAILDHPNMRLIITNGGLLSIMEAIYSAVPVLGLSLFFDELANMNRVRRAGIAKVLDLNTLSTETLSSSIHELIENPKYAQRAKEMSFSFRDRPMSPLQTAIWWTEYALRHRNVCHIRLNEEEIPLMRYYRLDNLFSITIRVGLVVGAISLFAWRVIQRNRKRQRQLQE
ncbi:hypothetical protein KR018_002699, partial [Drosophila ironensis]